MCFQSPVYLPWLPLLSSLSRKHNAFSVSWLLSSSRIPTSICIYNHQTNGSNGDNTKKKTLKVDLHTTVTYFHTLAHYCKPATACKARRYIHSFRKRHAKKKDGAMRGFFLASKSRLGCRPVCPYSAQTCQTFHHQHEWAKVPHSFAVAWSDLHLTLWDWLAFSTVNLLTLHN